MVLWWLNDLLGLLRESAKLLVVDDLVIPVEHHREMLLFVSNPG